MAFPNSSTTPQNPSFAMSKPQCSRPKTSTTNPLSAVSSPIPSSMIASPSHSSPIPTSMQQQLDQLTLSINMKFESLVNTFTQRFDQLFALYQASPPQPNHPQPVYFRPPPGPLRHNPPPSFHTGSDWSAKQLNDDLEATTDCTFDLQPSIGATAEAPTAAAKEEEIDRIGSSQPAIMKLMEEHYLQQRFDQLSTFFHSSPSSHTLTPQATHVQDRFPILNLVDEVCFDPGGSVTLQPKSESD